MIFLYSGIIIIFICGAWTWVHFTNVTEDIRKELEKDNVPRHYTTCCVCGGLFRPCNTRVVDVVQKLNWKTWGEDHRYYCEAHAPKYNMIENTFNPVTEKYEEKYFIKIKTHNEECYKNGKRKKI